MGNKKKFNIVTHRSQSETLLYNKVLELFRSCPIPDNELLDNLGLYLNSRVLSRHLFMNEIYKKILDIHGVIIEFGTRWGQNLSLFSALRGIYEPFNKSRKIVGFDTFNGFCNPLTDKDADIDSFKIGEYSVSDNYEKYLDQIMSFQEQFAPLSHLKKYEIIKGNAGVEIYKYLKENPETIISLAYFDMDVYTPTKECLLAIKDHLTKGSVLAFDELLDHKCPGETLALKEVFGVGKYSIKRVPITARCSYLVIGE